jgi:hypothetical protein
LRRTEDVIDAQSLLSLACKRANHVLHSSLK